MTNAEMNRRLATMSSDAIAQISVLVLEGWGQSGITNGGNPHKATIKQINAVFQMVQQTPGYQSLPLDHFTH
jgi:hypothetical protein